MRFIKRAAARLAVGVLAVAAAGVAAPAAAGAATITGAAAHAAASGGTWGKSGRSARHRSS